MYLLLCLFKKLLEIGIRYMHKSAVHVRNYNQKSKNVLLLKRKVDLNKYIYIDSVHRCNRNVSRCDGQPHQDEVN